MAGSHKILSVCSVFAGRARLSLESVVDGIIIKAYDKITGKWIGAVSVDSGDFSHNTPDANKRRISEAVQEAISKGHGFNPDATAMILSHANWNKLSTVIRHHASLGLVTM